MRGYPVTSLSKIMLGHNTVFRRFDNLAQLLYYIAFHPEGKYRFLGIIQLCTTTELFFVLWMMAMHAFFHIVHRQIYRAIGLFTQCNSECNQNLSRVNTLIPMNPFWDKVLVTVTPCEYRPQNLSLVSITVEVLVGPRKGVNTKFRMTVMPISTVFLFLVRVDPYCEWTLLRDSF